MSFPGHGRGQTPDVPKGDVEELLAGAREGDYVAIQAFIDPEREAELEPLVERARATGCVVTVGLGPRYLHSTGQLHKGGPPTGRFIQVVDDAGEELAIPGRPYGFGELIRAQAAGDYAALAERGPPYRPRLDWRRYPHEARDGRPRPHGRQHGGAPAAGTGTRWRPTRARRPSGRQTRSSSSATQLEQPRVVWLMIPAGDATEKTFQNLLPLLEDGDTLVDGGNSNFRDSQRRAAEATKKGVCFLDAGVSGGIWGLAEGYCLMVGGDESRLQAWSSPHSPRSRPRAATRTSARRVRATS